MSSPVHSLNINWATHEAARYACETWHYSQCLPAGKTVKIGVWENGSFIGCVIFSRGANASLGKPYGFTQLESCELTRVALDKHSTPVTRIVSIALKFLKRHNPGIKLVISFADTEQGHHGGIYQGGNWIYSGMTKSADEYLVFGKRMHGRSMRATWGTHVGKPFIKIVRGSTKHRYLMALDDSTRKMILQFQKPYPKRASSKGDVASEFHSEEPGSSPRDALQSNG